jgi:hypothetical protein
VQRLAARCKAQAERTGYLTLYDGARHHYNLWQCRYAPDREETKPCSAEEAQPRKRDPKHPWYGHEGIVPLQQMHDGLDFPPTRPL